ncbi:hypothetical protein QNO07_12575 [Streptomyces sp. 549]|uniref:hypothetical protein n=1 Tax=Streptomyces sp. 549 TaxID=3049076 RepID=UPI0024C2C940|nr:hypothetical protein [Streptomyces sp. 549]MDK1474243.1 hypothetical protein [Streptomyces sp. 549]
MNIDWAALGQVFGVSLVATLALVGVFTLGIVGSSARGADGNPTVLGRVGAFVSYGICALAVAYGIWIIAA